MSVRDPLNRHQKAFLRKMRNDPDGLPQEQWPQAVVLRRWLRKPRFKRALKSLRETFAAEIDVMLALRSDGIAGRRTLQDADTARGVTVREGEGVRSPTSHERRPAVLTAWL